MSHLLSPSLLSADFANLQTQIEMLNRSEADWLHLDIMDGVFVPNITFGMPIVKFIKKHSKKPLDVHLMIVKPERYINDFAEAGADILTIHYEACTHLHRAVTAIKDLGMKAGVSLNPHTPISVLDSIIDCVDMVLIMSVNPGFAAQKFIPFSIKKITELKKMILSRNLNVLIQVDGGVSKDNAKRIVEAGTDVLVAGNAVFNSDDPILSIRDLKLLK